MIVNAMTEKQKNQINRPFRGFIANTSQSVIAPEAAYFY